MNFYMNMLLSPVNKIHVQDMYPDFIYLILFKKGLLVNNIISARAFALTFSGKICE